MVLPLILGMLGGGLGSAGALGALGALGGASIGAGLGGYAQTGDLETGILTGLGAFAGGALLGPALGGAGSAAPAAAGAPAAAVPGAAAGTSAATGAAAGVGAPGLTTMYNPGAAGIAGLPMKANLATIGSSAAPMNAIANPGLLRGAANFAKTGMGMGAGVGASIGSALAPPPQAGGGGKYKGLSAKEMKPLPRNVQFPTAPTTGSSEFNYGFGPPPSAEEIIAFRDAQTNPYAPSRSNPYRMAGGGMIRSLSRTFGPIRLAEGGIASLMEEDDDGEMEDEVEIEVSTGRGKNEKDVVVDAVRAIKGESDNPQIALGVFLAQYGEDALRDLVDRVQSGDMDDTVSRSGGKMRGPGDGMDDMIPATIEGEEDVLLSDGEFVVPADVVSGLGNGSTDAGSRALEEMMSRVRQARNGTDKQPPQVPQEAMLPA